MPTSNSERMDAVANGATPPPAPEPDRKAPEHGVDIAAAGMPPKTFTEARDAARARIVAAMQAAAAAGEK